MSWKYGISHDFHALLIQEKQWKTAQSTFNNNQWRIIYLEGCHLDVICLFANLWIPSKFRKANLSLELSKQFENTCIESGVYDVAFKLAYFMRSNQITFCIYQYRMMRTNFREISMHIHHALAFHLIPSLVKTLFTLTTIALSANKYCCSIASCWNWCNNNFGFKNEFYIAFHYLENLSTKTINMCTKNIWIILLISFLISLGVAIGVWMLTYFYVKII